jgi:hypothetical protein
MWNLSKESMLNNGYFFLIKMDNLANPKYTILIINVIRILTIKQYYLGINLFRTVSKTEE